MEPPCISVMGTNTPAKKSGRHGIRGTGIGRGNDWIVVGGADDEGLFCGRIVDRDRCVHAVERSADEVGMATVGVCGFGDRGRGVRC